MTATTMRSFRLTRFGAPLCEMVDPLPVPQGSEVLLRVRACGVCHSDLHLEEGFFDLGGGQRMDLSRGVDLPRTPGHEVAGEVVALGPEAQGAAVGERRIVYPWIGCGHCGLCEGGREHLCARPAALGVSRDGGFSDHVLVPHPRYLFDPGGVEEALACTYACSGLTAFSAVRQAAAERGGGPLLILGAGGVGLAGVRIAREVHGIAPLVAEPDRARWAAAEAAGAAEVFDPGDPAARKRLLQATDGGVGAAVDFVGATASTEFALSVLRKGGALVVVGLYGGATTLALPTLPLRAIRIIGSYVGSREEMAALMRIAREGRLRGLPITERPLAEAQAALDALRAGRVVGRTVLRP